MKIDIVCAEDELYMAANNIVGYGDFLVRTIESYINILAEVQEKGINDDLISSRLSAIAESLTPIKTSIFDECESLSDEIKDNIVSVAENDNFKFPGDLISSISSLLGQFL